MSFDWSTFIDLAETLRNSSDEANHRSSISRAYYGAFILARNIASIFGGHEVHQKVYRFFRDVDDSNAQIIANNLRFLRTMRNSADYDNHFPESNIENTSLECLQRARIIMQLLG